MVAFSCANFTCNYTNFDLGKRAVIDLCGTTACSFVQQGGALTHYSWHYFDNNSTVLKKYGKKSVCFDTLPASREKKMGRSLEQTNLGWNETTPNFVLHSGDTC